MAMLDGSKRTQSVKGHVTDAPTDAQWRVRALSRWEGEGGALGKAASPGDAPETSRMSSNRSLERILHG
jgi:hypothetical protein